MRSLAFKRFLDIAVPLKLNVSVVTDNDGKSSNVSEKYKDYEDLDNIKICYSQNDDLHSLEPHIANLNSLEKLNSIFGVSKSNEEEILSYMENNKALCALRLFETAETINLPDYIKDTIK